MAMKQLLKVTLDAKQIREACEAYVAKRIDTETESATAAINDPNLTIDVVIRKRQAPRKAKANGVASAQPLSPAEERFA